MRVMVVLEGHGADEEKIAPTAEMLQEMGAFNEELVKAGIMLDGQGLQPSRNGAKVVFAGEDTSVVDGPFTESKELIAGFWLWEVASLAEAVEWAKRIPHDAHYGSEQTIELRPIMEIADFGDAYTPEIAEHEAKLSEQIKAQHGV